MCVLFVCRQQVSAKTKGRAMKNNKLTIGIIALILVSGVILWNNKKPAPSPVTVPNQSTQQKLSPESEITHGHGLAVDVADSKKLYIATHHGLLVLVNDTDLYRVGTSNDDYMGFSVHPTNANTFFSSGHPERGGNVGFQKSEDGGNSWKKISNGLNGPVDFHAMAVSPVNPDLVFGWYQGNLQRSSDGGKTWVKFTTQAPFVALAGDTSDENVVYATSPQGLFKSHDKGETWEQLLDGFVAAIAIHPSNSQTLLISSEKLGFAKSNDGGQNWQSIDANLQRESPLFIAYDRQSPTTVNLLTEKNSIYKSNDSGESWNKIR